MDNDTFPKFPTRTDYLEGKCTHAEYYEALANTARVKGYFGPFSLDQVREALAKGDIYLNTLPLAKWSAWCESVVPWNIAGAFKAHGDYTTLGGLVCFYKQCAIRAAKGKVK